MEVKELLRAKAKPFESQKAFARRFVVHPVHLGAFVLAICLSATGALTHEYRTWGHWENTGWIAMRHSAYLITLYFSLPYIFRFAILNRVPFAVLLVGLYSSYISIYMLLSGSWGSQFTHVPTITRWANNIAIAVPFILGIAGVLGREAAMAAFHDPKLYPTWTRYTPEPDAPEELPVERVSSIRYMQSQPPYTLVVTDSGSHTVKSSLAKMIEQLSEDDRGWRVHRSYWVAKSVVSQVTYVNGNPHLVLDDEETLPISRKAVAEVQDYLKAKAFAETERAVRPE